MGSLAPHQSRSQERIAIQNSLLRRHARGEMPLPEELIEAAAFESCRLYRSEHCGTFFALWSLLYPQSPTLKRSLSASRKTGTEAARYLTLKSLAELRILFGRVPLDAGQTYLPAEAEHLTGRFRRHYHHVVPFSRDRLDEIWDRCREADCEERRLHAEAEIGVASRRIRRPDG
jgi:hypothetical protein